MLLITDTREKPVNFFHCSTQASTLVSAITLLTQVPLQQFTFLFIFIIPCCVQPSVASELNCNALTFGSLCCGVYNILVVAIVSLWMYCPVCDHRLNKHYQVYGCGHRLAKYYQFYGCYYCFSTVEENMLRYKYGR